MTQELCGGLNKTPGTEFYLTHHTMRTCRLSPWLTWTHQKASVIPGSSGAVLLHLVTGRAMNNVLTLATPVSAATLPSGLPLTTRSHNIIHWLKCQWTETGPLYLIAATSVLPWVLNSVWGIRWCWEAIERNLKLCAAWLYMGAE